ncbi:MAG: galactose-1-epimerase, partial [Clostridia bacterium]|nr:galactose-1-epimerase [Clostridia bacterium]
MGRNANRIGGAKFSIDGTEYPLVNNDNGNNLHSGPNGYHLRVWDAETVDGDEPAIILTLASEYMDQGYPGAAVVKVTYTL